MPNNKLTPTQDLLMSLDIAIDDNSFETHWHLDLQKGELALVNDEMEDEEGVEEKQTKRSGHCSHEKRNTGKM